MKNHDSVFCPHCVREVSYSLSSECVETNVRGTEFSYVELSAYCKECGNEIYVAEINDHNVEVRSEAYRLAKNLITIEEIKEILDMYSIGAGPLAKLIGFGEVTINRYILGQLPSRENSEKLRELKNDRKLMEEFLENGKDKICSETYERCRKALDKLNELYGKDKIEVVTRYFLRELGEVGSFALQKLLYYAQAFYNAIFDEVLFDDDCQAWVGGPVFPKIYNKYKYLRYDPLNNPFSDCKDDIGILTEKEKMFLDTIISTFGVYSGWILSGMTHKEKPWLEARGTLNPNDRSVTVIEKESINQYFKAVIKNFNIVNPCDISNYSNYMYGKVR